MKRPHRKEPNPRPAPKPSISPSFRAVSPLLVVAWLCTCYPRVCPNRIANHARILQTAEKQR
nr:MAG TPA: hypothetical protein [Caudoviricetes sp.]